MVIRVSHPNCDRPRDLRELCYSSFNDHRPRTSLQTLYEEHREVSVGWTAQYELYDKSLQGPELVEEWQFKLEPIEVTQQLRTFSKMVKLDPTNSGNRYTAVDLAMHFPVSIGDKLDIFTALRLVYIRKRCGKSSSLDPCGLTSSWIILPIPIEHRGHSKLLDSSSLSGVREESSEADTK